MGIVVERELDEDEEQEDEDDTNKEGSDDHSEGWWLVVGRPKENDLVAIKRVTVPTNRARSKYRLDFEAPETPGDYEYACLMVCDSWVGADRQMALSFTVN